MGSLVVHKTWPGSYGLCSAIWPMCASVFDEVLYARDLVVMHTQNSHWNLVTCLKGVVVVVVVVVFLN